MKHEYSGWHCDVAHYKDGKRVPQCKVCSICGQYIPYDKVDEECQGPKVTGHSTDKPLVEY